MAEQPKGMFATSLISEKVIAELPAPYKIRALEREDYHKGVLQCLEVLTQIGDVTEKQFNDRYDWINNEAKGTYFFLVIDDGERIVATGALIVEKKFIHNLGTIGHIEEVSVLKDQQGKKLGLSMIQALDSVAVKLGCYKAVLTCGEHNEAFYIKCGYQRQAIEMGHYFEKGKTGWERG